MKFVQNLDKMQRVCYNNVTRCILFYTKEVNADDYMPYQDYP